MSVIHHDPDFFDELWHRIQANPLTFNGLFDKFNYQSDLMLSEDTARGWWELLQVLEEMEVASYNRRYPPKKYEDVPAVPHLGPAPGRTPHTAGLKDLNDLLTIYYQLTSIECQLDWESKSGRPKFHRFLQEVRLVVAHRLVTTLPEPATYRWS